MKRINLSYEWIREVLPEGITVPSSTIISGPGGSAKPLIAAMILSEWLRQKGKIIHLLINSDRMYAQKLLALYGTEEKQMKGNVFFIEFDPQVSGIEEVSVDHLKANILKKETWDESMNRARIALNDPSEEALIFGAAMNILLFSPTFGNSVFQRMLTMVGNGTFCLFTISNNVFEEKMARIEQAAQNLLFTYTEKIMEMYLKVERMKDVPFKKGAVKVPLNEEELRQMRSEAEKMRKHLIPMLRKI